MTRTPLVLALLAVLSQTVGCARTVQQTTGTLPTNSAASCTTYCSQMAMTLSAMVVMAGRVGCVCTPPAGAPTPAAAPAAPGPSAAASAAGGMAAIIAEEEAAAMAARTMQTTTHSTYTPMHH